MAVKHAKPIGTPEELNARRMSLSEYGCCAKRVKNPDGEGWEVVGCEEYQQCQFVKGGDVPKDWQWVRDKGPEHVPVRIVSDNGGIVERQLPCVDYMELHHRYNEIPDSGGAVEVISGKQYLLRGSRPKTVVENGKAITTHEDFAELTEVEPFPRPGKNQKFLGDVLAQESRLRAVKERRMRARDERLGVGDVEENEEPEQK